MPASERRITRADLVPDEVYAAQRRARRAALLPVKKLRRVHLGPWCTVIFESFETMLFQVQEMLLTEKGGEAQIPDELHAYNPLIPQGDELVATILFEIDDPVRRAAILAELGGVEDHFFLLVGESRCAGLPEGDVERTREDGKTSSVHFLHFRMTADQVAAFRNPSVPVRLGCDHPRYDHTTALAPATREELASDLG
ncbi:MAG TPA: DUF3501 family protein [Caulobacteraceae bacterium]|nr:DUF3501 family protein [Caulobacteraceae bacterium]